MICALVIVKQSLLIFQEVWNYVIFIMEGEGNFPLDYSFDKNMETTKYKKFNKSNFLNEIINKSSFIPAYHYV